MNYAIFEIPLGKQGEAKMLEKDDIISRQTIVIRDGKALGLDTDATYIKIEGSEEATQRAADMVADHDLGIQLTGDEAKTIYDTIADEEESASHGMGMIFD